MEGNRSEVATQKSRGERITVDDIYAKIQEKDKKAPMHIIKPAVEKILNQIITLTTVSNISWNSWRHSAISEALFGLTMAVLVQ